MSESGFFRRLMKSPQELSKGSFYEQEGKKYKVTSINKVEFIQSNQIVVIGRYKEVKEEEER